MTFFDSIALDFPGKSVARIRLVRPNALNAINTTMRAELPGALEEVRKRPDVRALVIGGAGNIFSAGADLKENLEEVDIGAILMKEYKPTFDAIADLPLPVISAIEGSASGIALSLALICDLSVMAEDAFLLCPFSTINLIPDGGGNFLLGRQLGYKRAYEMAITAQRMPAADALEYGLVNRLCPPGTAMAQALAWAEELSKRAPMALANTKRVMRFAMENSYEATFCQEARVQQACLESDDFREGRRAFIEKRPPKFSGR